MVDHIDENTRIAIVGAGAAGLATAHYLKEQGFREVTVFEKLGRVGGLCRSVTDGYKSFDLGGNYVTPAYRETLKIAKSVGAKPIKAHEYIGARVEGEEVCYYDIYDLVRQTSDQPDASKPVSLFALARAVLRYGWLRWKLREVIDQPTMAGIHDHPELCIPFEQWLKENDLLAMRRMFEIPITMMGYGFLDQIATPYALKYISMRTYLAMVQRGIPGLKRLARWPKRFEFGFGRMWERVSWDLNVRLDVEITKITRHPNADRPVRIRFTHDEQIGDSQIPRGDELWFDRLILACPLTILVLDQFLDLTNDERNLFSKVKPYSFCQTSLHCVDSAGQPFRLEKPVVCVFPFTPDTIGKPWALVQYWGDASPMLQLYSRISRDDESVVDRGEVIGAVTELLRRMGASPAGADDPKEARWIFYTCWPYFGHVTPDEMSKGFFFDLERVQGDNSTYYVGGVTNFELIEPILEYSKHIVETHFADRGDESGA